MTHVETGIQGAKRQSFDRDNPRDLLFRLHKQNPRAGEGELLTLITEELLSEVPEHAEYRNYLKSLIGYWFAAAYRSLFPARKPSPQNRAAQAKERSGRIEKITQQVVSISLSFIMPSGKTLRDSTGKECAQAGGWFCKIAQRLKPNEKVGNVLTDGQLRKIVA